MHDDPLFTLTPAEREAFHAQGFDPDAVEQLLRRMPPAPRAAKLQSLIVTSGSVSALSDYESRAPDVSVLEKISNPAMQELLDKAWAPRWRRYSLEQLEKMNQDQPGIAIAIQEKRKKRGA